MIRYQQILSKYTLSDEEMKNMDEVISLLSVN